MTAWVNWPVVPVALPLFAGVLLLLLRSPVQRRWVSAVAAFGQLAVAAFLVVSTLEGPRLVLGVGGGAPPLGIVLVVDLLAAFMLVLSALMLAGCQAYAFAESASDHDHPLRLPLWQFLVVGVNLSFVTGDLFNLFVAFELMLIASYALLTLEADDWDVKQAFPYVALNLVGGSLFLVAVGFIYGVFGTLNMAQLAERFGEQPDHPAVMLSALLLFAVFALKAGVFPLYYWLPESYPTLAAPVAAFFAGMLTKVGVYVLVRIYGTIYPHDLHGMHDLMGWLGAVTMVVAVLGAVSGSFIRGILSWHILSQIGYMVLALGLFTRTAVAACIFYIIHHIIVKGTLFLAGAAAGARRGSDDLDQPGGVAALHPVLAACFFLQALSLAGAPPLSGFWGKFVIVTEGLKAGVVNEGGGFPSELVWVGAAVLAGILTLFSMLKIWNGAFWGGKIPDQVDRVPVHFAGMVAVCAVLTLVSLAIGLGAGTVWSWAEAAADQAMDQQGYIRAVMEVSGKGARGVGL
jgi:multicomponent Na+:H+ antiporter subunit D